MDDRENSSSGERDYVRGQKNVKMIIPPSASELSGYRTVLCRNRNDPGGCRMKEKCIYAHNTDQLRKTTDPVPEFAVKIYEKLNRKKRNQSKASRKSNQEAANNSQKAKFIFGENDYVQKHKEYDKYPQKNNEYFGIPQAPNKFSEFDVKSSGYYNQPHHN